MATRDRRVVRRTLTFDETPSSNNTSSQTPEPLFKPEAVTVATLPNSASDLPPSPRVDTTADATRVDQQRTEASSPELKGQDAVRGDTESPPPADMAADTAPPAKMECAPELARPVSATLTETNAKGLEEDSDVEGDDKEASLVDVRIEIDPADFAATDKETDAQVVAVEATRQFAHVDVKNTPPVE